MTSEYNTTQLHPDTAFEKHVYHRDMMAHFLRWSYVLNMCDRFLNILDMGCGSAELLEVLYRNRRRPLLYTGVDIREQQIEKNKVQFKDLPFPVEFWNHDLTEEFHFKTKNADPQLAAPRGEKCRVIDSALIGAWDIITCFEVIEHIPRDKQVLLLKNLCFNAGEETLILISTPNYSEKQGAAANHTVNGVILERTYSEMLKLIEDAGMKVVRTYGTFASMKDIENNLTTDAKLTFMKLREYHCVDILSVMFAPLIPQYSRNIMYLCKRETHEMERNLIQNITDDRLVVAKNIISKSSFDIQDPERISDMDMEESSGDHELVE